jgi:hypothetical protein
MKDTKFAMIVGLICVVFAIVFFLSFHIANADECSGLFVKSCGNNKYCGDNNALKFWTVEKCNSFTQLESCSITYNGCSSGYKCTIASPDTYGKCEPIANNNSHCFSYLNNQCVEIQFFSSCGTIKNSYLTINECLTKNPFDYSCGGNINKLCPSGYVCQLERPDIENSIGQCVAA